MKVFQENLYVNHVLIKEWLYGKKENKERANEKNRKWVKENYIQKYENSKNSKLIKEYGITLEQYNNLSELQNHKCKICGKEETKMLNDTKWKLSVDHCHTTGRIRGLLCAKCNVGLAKFEEDEQQFLNAIKYLKGELWNILLILSF